jgi:hypothetical protein
MDAGSLYRLGDMQELLGSIRHKTRFGEAAFVRDCLPVIDAFAELVQMFPTDPTVGTSEGGSVPRPATSHCNFGRPSCCPGARRRRKFTVANTAGRTAFSWRRSLMTSATRYAACEFSTAIEMGEGCYGTPWRAPCGNAQRPAIACCQ